MKPMLSSLAVKHGSAPQIGVFGSVCCVLLGPAQWDDKPLDASVAVTMNDVRW